jgi:hypothetical protein
VETEEERPFDFLAIARRYMQCDDIAVRHSALKLCCQTFHIETLDADLICEAMAVVHQLADHDWHPHLLSIFANLLRFPFPEPFPPAVEIFEGLWSSWWSSHGCASRRFMTLIGLSLHLLPLDTLMQVASLMGTWFGAPDDKLPFCDVMNVALMLAQSVPSFPQEFFAVLPFCQTMLEAANIWIAPFSEMIVPIVTPDQHCRSNNPT